MRMYFLWSCKKLAQHLRSLLANNAADIFLGSLLLLVNGTFASRLGCCLLVGRDHGVVGREGRRGKIKRSHGKRNVALFCEERHLKLLLHPLDESCQLSVGAPWKRRSK